jgi:hypothetical protein
MVETYKNKFNKKYHLPKDTAHTIAEVSKLTGFKKSGLDTIMEKGKGAFYSNHAAVRPQVKSPEQWGMARIYSAVMGGKAARVDKSQLIKL